MSEFEFDTTPMSDNRYEKDSAVAVKFYAVAKLDQAKTDEAGRPVFSDVDYIEIFAAGNSNNIIRRPVRQMDIDRFPKAYEAYKAGNLKAVSGTPLEEVAWLSRAWVESLKHSRILTLEALAEVGDDVCGRIAGLHELKLRAKLFMDKASKEAPILALQKQNEELQARLKALESAKTK